VLAVIVELTVKTFVIIDEAVKVYELVVLNNTVLIVLALSVLAVTVLALIIAI
jgi:hypothetical protein